MSTVRLSVTFRYRDRVGWLEYFENNFMAELFKVGADPNMGDLPDLVQREHAKITIISANLLACYT